jgi:hypothetical protein
MTPIEFDVFNGDADGLFAAHQLRLAEPGPDPAAVRTLTGMKRDIALLDRIDLAAFRDRPLDLRVFDVSVARNRNALERLLAQGAAVRWFDHHHAGPMFAHPRLELHIDVTPDTCTSVLVDAHLQGRYRRWAVAAAFGDNLPRTAQAMSAGTGVSTVELAQLRELGEAVNYNGYGETRDDALIEPAALYVRLAGHVDPLDFVRRDPIVTQLAARRRTDLAIALQVPPWREYPAGAIYRLPDEGWCRRVLGSFANLLAERAGEAAFAVLKARRDGGYVASVRAPCSAPKGADRLCRRFGGDGRAAAAGIDRLAEELCESFASAFAAHDWGR